MPVFIIFACKRGLKSLLFAFLLPNTHRINAKMVSKTTDGITVSVETEYQPEYSSPRQWHFVFTYKITIANNSPQTVQLLRRQWFIYDANGEVAEVEGEGVVGQQPVIEPGQQHQYVSVCNLKTGMGKMEGSYLMERIIDGKQFVVYIPVFNMVVPYRLN
jgi:ApaG protein